jgi:hypothetical protein
VTLTSTIITLCPSYKYALAALHPTFLIPSLSNQSLPIYQHLITTFTQPNQTLNMRFTFIATTVLAAGVANAQIESLLSSALGNIPGVSSIAGQVSSALNAGPSALSSAQSAAASGLSSAVAGASSRLSSAASSAAGVESSG